MRFGPVAIDESIGATAAHSVHGSGVSLRKGETITREHVAALREAGIERVVVAQLEPGDVPENEAARRLAQRIVGPGLFIDRAFTGRANIFAETAGVLQVDAAAVDRINDVDESLTLATLPPLRAVVAGEMVGTVKIIPFAVPGRSLEAVMARVEGPPLSLAPFRALRVAVISTLLPGLKPSVVAKTIRVLGERLAPAAAPIVADERIAHEAEALTAALRSHIDAADLVVVFGASAIADRRDVIPASIEAAGGEVLHFGMPVDPGNLLLLGRLRGKPVLGAPGCARSPKENGFDWVLQRLLAGIPVTASDIRRLGAGGLLMEIITRPQPRDGGTPEPLASPDESPE